MRRYFSISGIWLVLAAFLCSVPFVLAEEATFQMEEFSIFEYEGPLAHMLSSGTRSGIISDELGEDVKASPKFTSEKPLYGKVQFMGKTLFPQIEYYIALDESEGTGKGYDRLYFDGNRDFDLTNDGVVKKAEKSPAKNPGPDAGTYFEPLTLKVDGKPVKFVPMFGSFNPDYRFVSFIHPAARRGTIKIGSKEHEAILAKGVLPGGYEQPYSQLILDNNYSGFDTLGLLRSADGVLYECTAASDGSSVTVRPYAGGFGTLAVADVKKQFKKTDFGMGWLISKDRLVDLSQCTRENGGVKIPVGDYAPIRMMVRVDDIRLTYAADFAGGTESFSFPIKIRKNAAFGYPVNTPLKIRFESPEPNQRIVPGHTVRIAASLVDTQTGMLLGGLEDVTKPKGEPVKISENLSLQQYESIDPWVSITNAAGKQVAEGKMPFG